MSVDRSLSVVCQKDLSSEICPFLPFVEKLSVCEVVLAICCYRNRWGTPDLYLADGQSFDFSTDFFLSNLSYIQCWMFIVTHIWSLFVHHFFFFGQMWWNEINQIRHCEIRRKKSCLFLQGSITIILTLWTLFLYVLFIYYQTIV